MVTDISSITQTIDTKNDFSFVDKLGSFIGNSEFHKSFADYKNGQVTKTTFVWEALQAIGDEVGKKIYSNIRDYIDLVSNVDRCKAKNLQSMMSMYGEKFQILDNIDGYPLEVQNLIDLFSIQRKYILKNDFLRDDFIQDLESEGVLSSLGENHTYGYYKDDYDQYKISVDETVFNSEMYENYIKKIFKNLLSDFLELNYNDTPKTKIIDTFTEDDLRGYTISSYYSLKDSNIQQFRDKYIIPASFDEQEIVDAIDNGKDFLDNYVGFELELLKLEIARRAQTLKLTTTGVYKFKDNENQSIELKTKYSYYRKAKVLEYYHFINNIFTQPGEISGNGKYVFDERFFEIPGNDINVLSAKDDYGYTVNEEILDYAAECLTRIVSYITSLRERIKLQTRKNYMKGTNNLLRYLINQYLVDYGKTSYLFKKYENVLSDIQERMIKHSSENVNVVEYFDETEYYNLETVKTPKALNSGNVNQRFWQGEGNQKTGTFSDNEIKKFYMNDLALSSNSQVSDLIEFLDVIYNLGANTSYIDKNTGEFVSILSNGVKEEDNDIYSDTLYNQVTAINYNYNLLTSRVGDDYEYPDDTISNQISNIVDDRIYGILSGEYLSAVSAVYDKYKDRLSQLSGDLYGLKDEVKNFVSGDYSFYFEEYKSTDDTLSYINWLREQSKNIVYTEFKNFISDCYNNLSNDISGYTTNILDPLLTYGYINPKNAILGDTLMYAEQYMTNLINTRMDKLNSDELSSLSNDTIISGINVILSNLVNVRENYEQHLNKFRSIIQNGEYTEYITDFSLDSNNYSLTNLEAISSFIISKDKLNQKNIINEIDGFEIRFYEIKTDVDELERDVISELKLNPPENQTIEEQITYVNNKLIDSIDTKTAVGMESINEIMDVVKGGAAYVSSVLSLQLSVQEPLSDAINEYMSTINYENFDIYSQQKKFYDFYNGLCSDSDIYYNHKNVTHPSKQYHPYLWNFTQSDKLMKESSTSYNLWQIQNLTEENIQKTISRYIGEFGQSINFWKNEGMDYTGYSSRYEKGDNKTQAGLKTVSKVADYDGGFFPDAVDYLQEKGVEECIRQLSSLSGEFYTEYYLPNGCTEEDIKSEIERLSLFGEKIIELTKTQTNKKDVYDIYKYGLDHRENAYILYKKYSSDNPSFREQKDTPGTLWVRMADYPFAYPAFALSGGVIQVDSAFVAFTRAISTELKTDYDVLSGGSIYDFDFTEEKYALALMTKNGTVGGLEQYQAAKTFVASIYTDYIGLKNTNFIRLVDNNVDFRERMELLLGTNNQYAADFTSISSIHLTDLRNLTVSSVVNSETSVVFKDNDISSLGVDEWSGKPGTVIENLTGGILTDLLPQQFEQILTSNLSVILNTDTESFLSGYSDWVGYTLLGCYPIKSDNFYTFYGKKRITANEDGEISISLPNPTQVLMVDYMFQRVADSREISFVNTPTIEDIAVSLKDSVNVSLGFVVSSLMIDGNLKSYTTNTASVDLPIVVPKKDDYTRDDPQHKEMNSHDIYTSDIIVKNYVVQSSSLKEVSERIFNMNADMSYLPIYPGQECRFDISKSGIQGEKYYPVQLMGQSRNIDNIIKLVNPTPNPYFTMDDISEKYTFGRVYEDYLASDNKTLKLLDNPPINIVSTEIDYENPPAQGWISVDTDDKCFTWSIPLTKQFPTVEYNEKDFQTIKLVMFNIKNFGKNPYFMVNIADTIYQEVSAKYDPEDIGSFDVEVNDYIMASGTYNNKDVNKSESNHIYNIETITTKFNNDKKLVQIKFYMEDFDKRDQTFVDGGEIRVCILNDKDLSMFQYYHYLDAYGIHVYSEPTIQQEHTDVETEDFVIRRQSTIATEDNSSTPRYYSYYENKYGKRQYLKDIDFNKFNQLSDIEILQGTRGLQFKYDEELTFSISDDNFYYPTVNLKYPKSLADYVQSRGLASNMPEDIDITNVFKEDELYVIDIPNPEELVSSIGLINMTVSANNAGCILVSEDMFNKDKRLSPYDVRALSNFVFVDLDGITGDEKIIESDGRTLEQIFDSADLSDWELLGSEDSSSLTEYQFDASKLLSVKADDIKKLLRLYVNYKKDAQTNNGIVLYFNYNNYLNTPFIKLEDYRVYTDIIDGTYLKLAPGESGRLDIVIQFRYTEDDVIMGCDNVKVLTYQIYNISDDKPKFLIKEVYRVGDDDYLPPEYKFNLATNTLTVDYQPGGEFDYTIYWDSLAEIEEFTFDVLYDNTIIEFSAEQSSGIEVKTINNLVKTIKVQGNSTNSITLKMKLLQDGKITKFDIGRVKVTPKDKDKVVTIGTLNIGSITIL